MGSRRHLSPLLVEQVCAEFLLLSALFCISVLCNAQVFTVEPDHVASPADNLKNVQPTTVPLSKVPLKTTTREELIRLFQSEQAFAVRPLPLGKHGLALHANGPLSPTGEAYAKELEHDGISSKPGGRIIISKFDIKADRIVFEFNGGPEKHHHILQHIEIGGGIATAPLAQDNGQAPIGSRFTLLFNKFVPEMNAAQLRDLIAPILDFSLKTPDQAFADTLPPKLKNAVLDHEVLVGMNRDMVIHAMGQPGQRVRETENNVPFEEWIYGQPPHEVQFVRFVGNRVIRLEIANIGRDPIIRDKDETGGYFSGEFVHEVRLADAPAVKDGQDRASTNAPTLRQPGETLPDAVEQQRELKKVQFPSQQPATGSEPAGTAPSPGTQPGSPTQPGTASNGGPGGG